MAIRLHIPGFAIAYNSYVERDGKTEGEWRLSPLSVQAKDLPKELQDQIADWLKVYEAKRRGLEDVQFVLGESKYVPINKLLRGE